MELGHDENDSSSSSSTRQSLSFYKRIFFDPFLERTGVYYKDESERFIQENSVTEYMKKIETRLKEEEDRVMMYLHASSSKDVGRFPLHHSRYALCPPVTGESMGRFSLTPLCSSFPSARLA